MISTRTRLQYAQGYLELGMIREASLELKAITDEKEFERIDYLSLNVRLCLESRKWKRMIKFARKIAQLDPENAFGWVNWAYALRELEQTPEAKSVALDALKIHPKEAVLWFNLACYCSLLGEVEDASQHLDQAVALEKSFEAEAVDDPDLDNMWQWIRNAPETP